LKQALFGSSKGPVEVKSDAQDAFRMLSRHVVPCAWSYFSRFAVTDFSKLAQLALNSPTKLVHAAVVPP
jgi:hypothetical protein